jgi:hypothetical protein
MTAIAEANRAAAPVGDRRDRRGQHRKGSGPSHRPQACAVPVNGSRPKSATSAPAEVRSLPVLLAELVELGREAWRISERERLVRAEIEALRQIEENAAWQN